MSNSDDREKQSPTNRRHTDRRRESVCIIRGCAEEVGVPPGGAVLKQCPLFGQHLLRKGAMRFILLCLDLNITSKNGGIANIISGIWLLKFNIPWAAWMTNVFPHL